MNAAHLHLALNHAPVIGIVLVLILGIAAFVRRSQELQGAALWGFALVALMSVPAYLTGEPAEEVVESLAGINEAAIEEHEEAAALAFALAGFTGLLALGALGVGRRRGAARSWLGVVLLSALVTAAAMARTATLGGAIHHPEIAADVPGGGQLPADHD